MSTGVIYSTNASVKYAGNELPVSEIEVTITETSAQAAISIPITIAADVKIGENVDILFGNTGYTFTISGRATNRSLTNPYIGLYLNSAGELVMRQHVAFPGTVQALISIFDNTEQLLHYVATGGKLPSNNSQGPVDLGKGLSDAVQLQEISPAEMLTKLFNVLRSNNELLSKMKPIEFVNGINGFTMTPNVVLKAFVAGIVNGGYAMASSTLYEVLNYLAMPLGLKFVPDNGSAYSVYPVDWLPISSQTPKPKQWIVPLEYVEKSERIYSALYPRRTVAYMTVDGANNTTLTLPVVAQIVNFDEEKFKNYKIAVSDIFKNMADGIDETFGLNMSQSCFVPVTFDTAILLGQKFEEDTDISSYVDNLNNKLQQHSSNITSILDTMAKVRWSDLASQFTLLKVTTLLLPEIKVGNIVAVETSKGVYNVGYVSQIQHYWRATGYSYSEFVLSGVIADTVTFSNGKPQKVTFKSAYGKELQIQPKIVTPSIDTSIKQPIDKELSVKVFP